MRPIHIAVARAFGMEPKELMRRCNSPHVAGPRQVAMFLMRRAGFSLGQIGYYFAKHRTTVLYACVEIQKCYDESESVRAFVDGIRPAPRTVQKSPNLGNRVWLLEQRIAAVSQEAGAA